MSGMRICAGVAIVGCLALGGAIAIHSQELGTITFPTSGQRRRAGGVPRGREGPHSFQFDEAAVAFQRAQKADPSFAMAYWGEAMSHNHPLWAQQDDKAAKAILEKIAPTPRRARRRRSCRKRKRSSKRDRHPVLRAGRQARARHRLLGRDGADVRAVAGRSRGRRRGTRCRCSAPCGRPTRASAARRSPRRSPRRCSRKTRSIRAPRTSSFTRSTIPITRRWR